jgi:hypothetical protein
LIGHGHRLPDILDYTLAQLQGFSAAAARREALRDAQWLSLIAIGSRADGQHLNTTLEQLNAHARQP